MATTVTASNFTALLPCAGQLIKPTSPKHQSALPSQLGRVATNGGSCVIRCSSLEKRRSTGAVESRQKKAAAPLMAAAAAAVQSANVGSAMALVDERMSTEGTGLPFGLSNNLLGWILLGVFGLIWSFYTVYTSSLDEDEESGLSL